VVRGKTFKPESWVGHARYADLDVHTIIIPHDRHECTLDNLCQYFGHDRPDYNTFFSVFFRIHFILYGLYFVSSY
jgi:hypothetical protein